jgi:LPXTG-motif cell wall-anchored protein
VRRLALLTVLYALVAVIALPGPLSASQEVVPHQGLQAAAAQAEPDGSSPDAAGFESPEDRGPGLPGGAEAEAPAGGGSEPSAGVEPAPGVGVEPVPGAAAETAAATEAPAAAQQPAGAQHPAPAEPEPAAEPPAAEPQTASAGEAVESRAKRNGGDKPERVPPVARAAASQNVTIRNFAFSPKSVTIDVGDTVTWTNEDSVKHSATAEDGSFDTGLLGNGRSGSNTFDEAGAFQYFCKPHPSMKGTITVRAASSGGSGGDTGSGDDSSSSSGSSSTGSSSNSGSGSGSGSDSGSSSTGSGSSSSGSGSTSSGSGSTSSLPNTGAEPATLAIVGLLMLALGVAVQRRAHAGKSRPTGRIGS